MANIYDVGQYITELIPNVDKMKLYKLCYFSQGWNLAWTGLPLFKEPLQAWTKGPVPVALRDRSEPIAHCWTVDHIPGGNSGNLTTIELRTIESVVTFYKDRDSTELSEMSHGKAWQEARRGIPESEPCQEELSVTTMREEFTELLHSAPSTPLAPTKTWLSEKFSLETALAAAAQVEKTWNGSLALLATR